MARDKNERTSFAHFLLFNNILLYQINLFILALKDFETIENSYNNMTFLPNNC